MTLKVMSLCFWECSNIGTGSVSKTGVPESVWGSFQFGTIGFRPQIGTALKMGTPYWYGDPHIGMGRDMSIFQIGESPYQYGAHSNLGTNICVSVCSRIKNPNLAKKTTPHK